MIPGLVVEPAAEEDINLAYHWYENRAIGPGVEFLDSLETAFDLILQNPLMYIEAIPGIYRSLPKSFPYLIFYVVEFKSIHIIAVIHAAQNPKLIAERFEA